MDIHYLNMKATIHMTYKPIKNNIDTLLKEVYKLTYSHTIKADGIVEQSFENKKDKVYGVMYDLKGDVASGLQFFVTRDSSFIRFSKLETCSTTVLENEKSFAFHFGNLQIYQKLILNQQLFFRIILYTLKTFSQMKNFQ